MSTHHPGHSTPGTKAPSLLVSISRFGSGGRRGITSWTCTCYSCARRGEPLGPLGRGSTVSLPRAPSVTGTFPSTAILLVMFHTHPEEGNHSAATGSKSPGRPRTRGTVQIRGCPSGASPWAGIPGGAPHTWRTAGPWVPHSCLHQLLSCVSPGRLISLTFLMCQM